MFIIQELTQNLHRMIFFYISIEIDIYLVFLFHKYISSNFHLVFVITFETKSSVEKPRSKRWVDLKMS